jgi:hypothetical protein
MLSLHSHRTVAFCVAFEVEPPISSYSPCLDPLGLAVFLVFVFGDRRRRAYRILHFLPHGFSFFIFENEPATNASAINHEKALENANVRAGAQLNRKTIICYDFNQNTSCTIEKHANHQDSVDV